MLSCRSQRVNGCWRSPGGPLMWFLGCPSASLTYTWKYRKLTWPYNTWASELITTPDITFIILIFSQRAMYIELFYWYVVVNYRMQWAAKRPARPQNWLRAVRSAALKCSYKAYFVVELPTLLLWWLRVVLNSKHCPLIRISTVSIMITTTSTSLPLSRYIVFQGRHTWSRKLWIQIARKALLASFWNPRRPTDLMTSQIVHQK